MDITINVDESQFKEILDKELKALKPEELHEVLIQCIKEYFTIDNYKNLEHLLVENRGGYYGNKVPTEFTIALVKSCDYSKLQEVADACCEKLKTDHDTILKEIMLNAIVSGLTNNFYIHDMISTTIKNEIYSINNRQ